MTFGSGPIALAVDVTGKETLDVPAGKFECYKLLIKPVQQIFWIATDPHRYVVKFEAGEINGVLQSIRTVKPGDKLEYRDKDLGFSFSVPAEWYVIPDAVSVQAPEKLLTLMDPGAEAVSALHVRPLDKLSEEQEKSVREWAKSEVAQAGRAKKEFRVREASWQERILDGHPAVSCLADFVHRERPRVQYFLFGLGKSTATVFTAHTEPDRSQAYGKRLDAIINSYKAN